MSTRIYVLSPNPISIADARHYYPLIINASQAIRVHTSLCRQTDRVNMQAFWGYVPPEPRLGEGAGGGGRGV